MPNLFCQVLRNGLNKGTPADLLRLTASAHLLAALEHINALACYASEEDPEAMASVLLEIGTHARQAAALATKPAEMADEFERGRQQGMKQERALWNLAASSQEIEGHPTESAGKKVQRVYFHRVGSPGIEDHIDIPLGDDPKRHVADALIHRVLIEPTESAGKSPIAAPSSGHPAQAVASAVQRPVITERELAFALNYHSDDSRINDADWKIARRYFEVIERNRGTHPSLADTQRSSPTAGSDEAKDRGAPLGSEPATVWKIDWPEEQDEEPSYTENPNIAELARKMGRTVTAFAALASPPAGEKE